MITKLLIPLSQTTYKAGDLLETTVSNWSFFALKLKCIPEWFSKSLSKGKYAIKPWSRVQYQNLCINKQFTIDLAKAQLIGIWYIFKNLRTFVSQTYLRCSLPCQHRERINTIWIIKPQSFGQLNYCRTGYGFSFSRNSATCYPSIDISYRLAQALMRSD